MDKEVLPKLVQFFYQPFADFEQFPKPSEVGQNFLFSLKKKTVSLLHHSFLHPHFKKIIQFFHFLNLKREVNPLTLSVSG